MNKPDAESWFRAFTFTLAIILIGYALQISNGHLDNAALLWLTGALVACGAGGADARIARFERYGSRIIFATVGVGLACQFWTMFLKPPARYLKLSDANLYWIYLGGIVAAAAVTALSMIAIRPQIWLALLAAVHFSIGIWIIRMSPTPHIDVFYEQQEACRAIVHGHNPYTTTYPDAYGAAGARQSGLGYPAVSYLCALPGYLAGDIRYSHLAAMSLAALLFGLSRPGQLSALVAALFLFTPRTFFVLEQSWTEPFVLLLCAAAVYSKVRGHQRLLPIFLGLLIASKQHLFLAVPAMALLVESPFRWKDYLALVGKAVLAGAVVTLPFLLWNPAAFFKVMTAFSSVDIRIDSLSYTAWLWVHSGIRIPQWSAFLASFLALSLALWKLPRSASGFAAAIGIQYFVLILLSGTAFCNYYYMVLGFLAMAVASAQKFGCTPEEKPRTDGTFR